MSDDASDRGNSRREPKRYALHWEEGIRPDDLDDTDIETVGDDS